MGQTGEMCEETANPTPHNTQMFEGYRGLNPLFKLGDAGGGNRGKAGGK